MSKVKFLYLAALALAAPAQAEQVKSSCSIPQSPRIIWHYDGQSRTSTIKKGPDDSIYYTPRAGIEQHQLFLCGQHYHCYVENYYKCAGGEVPPPTGNEQCKEHPALGDWIEIHNVYASKVGTSCDRETLDCCLEGPFLVRAYHAKVAEVGDLPDAWTPPFIQWSGSTTGPDTSVNECKPAAQWSFTPECTFKVGKKVIEGRFHHPHRPRGLQSEDRLSHDLMLVDPKSD